MEHFFSISITNDYYYHYIYSAFSIHLDGENGVDDNDLLVVSRVACPKGQMHHELVLGSIVRGRDFDTFKVVENFFQRKFNFPQFIYLYFPFACLWNEILKIVIKTILDLYILIISWLKQFIKNIPIFQNKFFTCILNSRDLTSDEKNARRSWTLEPYCTNQLIVSIMLVRTWRGPMFYETRLVRVRKLCRVLS